MFFILGRKSLVDMSQEWALLRCAINAQPVPQDLVPIFLGEVVQSPYGDFIVEEFVPNSANIKGRLINWKLADGFATPAVLTRACLLKTNEFSLQCFECEQFTTTFFHFLGMECQSCGSFNTSKVNS